MTDALKAEVREALAVKRQWERLARLERLAPALVARVEALEGDNATYLRMIEGAAEGERQARQQLAAAEAERDRLREALADFDDFLADAFNAGIGAGHPLDSGHSRRGYEAERDALRAKHAAALAARPEETP